MFRLTIRDVLWLTVQRVTTGASLTAASAAFKNRVAMQTPDF